MRVGKEGSLWLRITPSNAPAREFAINFEDLRNTEQCNTRGKQTLDVRKQGRKRSTRVLVLKFFTTAFEQSSFQQIGVQFCQNLNQKSRRDPTSRLQRSNANGSPGAQRCTEIAAAGFYKDIRGSRWDPEPVGMIHAEETSS